MSLHYDVERLTNSTSLLCYNYPCCRQSVVMAFYSMKFLMEHQILIVPSHQWICIVQRSQTDSRSLFSLHTCKVLYYSFLLLRSLSNTSVLAKKMKSTTLYWHPTDIFTGQIAYNANNEICQLPFKLSISIIFAAFCVYVIPIVVTVVIY